MPSDPDLDKALNAALKALPPVQGDLQARPDFQKDDQFAAWVALLDNLWQALLDVRAAAWVSAKSANLLQALVADDVMPALQNLLSLNTAISKMGPLNPNRSLAPSTAWQYNRRISALQEALRELLARLAAFCQAPPRRPPVRFPGRLVRLEVQDAVAHANGEYVVDYAPNAVTTIRAVAFPDDPQTYASLIWEGGEAGDDASQRLVPRGHISPVGHPTAIAAWLGDQRLLVKIMVRPLLGALDVNGAVPYGERWLAHYSLAAAPVTVIAAMLPDTPEAHRHLRWQGGEVDPAFPFDRRRVPRNVLTLPGQALLVRASLNPERHVEIEVLPKLIELRVATEDGPVQPDTHSDGCDFYTLPYRNGWIAVSAMTEPMGDAAWAHIVWEGADGDAGQANRKLLPNAKLTRFGETGRRLQVRIGDSVLSVVIKVVPQLLGLEVTTVETGFVQPSAETTDSAEYWVAYAERQYATVSAKTVPPGPDAWAYLKWGGDGGNADQANRRQVPRNLLTPAGQSGKRVSASIASARLSAVIKVVPKLLALDIPVNAFPTGIPQLWYSYRIAADSGFACGKPMPQAIACAHTLPNNEAAWAHLVWQDNGKPGQVVPGTQGRLRAINLDSTNTVTLGAHIGNQQVAAQLQIREPQGTDGGVQLRVDSIRFDGGQPVNIDYPTGSSLSELQYPRAFPRVWHSRNPGTPEQYPQPVLYQPPLAYVRNTPVGIAAQLAVSGGDALPTPLPVRATGFLHGAEFVTLCWQQTLTDIPSGTASLSFAPCCGGRLPNSVQHEPELSVFWEVGDAAGHWELFDVTQHRLYVTLAAPVAAPVASLNDPDNAGAAYGFWSLLDIACRAARGCNNSANTAINIYQAFQPPSPNPGLCRLHDGAAFRYWDPGGHVAQHLAARSGNGVPPLLLSRNASGSSRAFAEMLVAMLAMQGIDNARLGEVKPNPVVSPEAVRILMRNWAFHPLPRPSGNAYAHYKNEAGTAPDPFTCAGWATWSAGMAQNNPAPPPALLDHMLVVLNIYGVEFYFDPAYGSVLFSTWPSWVNASVSGLERSKTRQAKDRWYQFLAPATPAPQPNAGFVKQGPAFPALAPDNLVKLAIKGPPLTGMP